MDVYFISYDLTKETGHDYTELYKALETFGAKRVLESVWCLKADDSSPQEVKASLYKHMHQKDRLLVVKKAPHPGWSSHKLMNDPNDL